MADNFAARKCKNYYVVCLVPDFCHPGPIPYPVAIDLSESANTSENTNFNSNGAFLYDQSDTVKVEGDDPGIGLGVLSLSIEGKCEPITFSSSMRVNGKQQVRENDLFYMNIGEESECPNTVGNLVFCETGIELPEYDGGEKSLLDKLYEGSGLKGMVDDFKDEQMDRFQAEVDLNEGMKAGDQVKVDSAVERINEYRREDSPFVDIGDTVIDTLSSLGEGDFSGAVVVAATGAAETAAKRIPGGKQVVKKVEDILEKTDGKGKGKGNNKKNDGGKVKGDDNQNKCKSSQGEKQKCKPGVYAGGRHGSIGPGGHGCTPKRESHHMPANSTYEKLNGGKVSDANKPAIQMDLDDHKQTSSYKYSKKSIEYRAKQTLLIKAGMYKQAMQMDIDEINDLFPGKYDEAIQEMKKWAKCMKYI